MSRQRPATPAGKKVEDNSVAQSNGPPTSQHPAAKGETDTTEAKLLAYIHDEWHLSFIRY